MTVVTRTTSSASFPEDIQTEKVPYTESELAKVFEGQDAVISAVGAAGFQEQKVFIDAAIKASVKRFLPSEFSSSTLNEAARRLVPVFELKKQVLDYLKEKESTGLTWTGLATGPLLDWVSNTKPGKRGISDSKQGLRAGFLGFELAGKKATIWDGGKTRFAATNQADFAEAIVGILKNPLGTSNKYLQVATVITSQLAILQSLQEKSGSNWTAEEVETDKQVAKGREMVTGGDFTGMFILAQAASYGNVEGINMAEGSTSNSVVGLPEEGSLSATIDEVLK